MNIEQTNKFFIDASFNHLIEVKNNGDALLTIHNDGTITAAEHLKPTETAAEVLRIMRETWMADAQSIKIRELRERIKRLEEVGDVAQSQGGQAVKDNCAFIYIHAWNGLIRVESLHTAKHVDQSPEWKHVATINPHVVLESILRAKGKERNLIIKHLLT